MKETRVNCDTRTYIVICDKCSEESKTGKHKQNIHSLHTEKPVNCKTASDNNYHNCFFCCSCVDIIWI